METESNEVVGAAVDALNKNEKEGLTGMDMNCVMLKADRVVGEEVFEVSVERTVGLDCADDISEISAEIAAVKGKVIDDNQVEISGLICKHIYYVGRGGMIHYHAEDMPFVDVVMITGAEPGMDMEVHVNAHILNVAHRFERGELYQRVDMEVFVKVTMPEQLSVVINPTGPLLKVDRVVSEQTTPTVVSGETELEREAIKIVRIDAHLEDVSYETAEDQVMVEGIVHKDVYYVGCNNLQYRQVEKMPFSTVIPVPGAEPGMDVMIEPRIERVNYQLEAPLPSRDLTQRVIMNIFAKVTEKVQINVCQDAHGPLIKAEHVVGENVKQVMIENDVELCQPALRVSDIHATINDIHCEVIENKVIIQGHIHKQIYFADCECLIRHMGEDVHFGTFVDVPGAMPGMNCQVHGRVEYIKPELMPAKHETRMHAEATENIETERRRPDRDKDEKMAFRMLHQKIVLELFIKVTETIQLRVKVEDPERCRE